MDTGKAAGISSDGDRPLKSGGDYVAGDFERALARAPYQREKLRSFADALLGSGRFDEARAAYRQILKHEPTDINAQVALGRIERRFGNHAAACHHLRAAVSSDPDNLQILTELATVFRDLNRLEEAASIYRRILAVNPEHAQSHMGLGLMASATLDHEAAFAHFTAAVKPLRAAAEADPHNLFILAQLATALRELDRPEEATSIYQKILARNPEQMQSHMGLGWIAYRRGNHEAALAHFKAAAELNPIDPQARITLAKVLALMHRFGEAEAIYKNVLLQAPSHLQVRAALGALARIKRDWAGALEQFRAAVASDPQNVQFRIDLGRTFCDLSKWDDAERTYRSILEDSPGNIEAMMGLAETARARGDTQAALTLFEDAAAAAPHDLRPKQEIRQLKMARGDYDWRTEIEDAVAAAHSTSASIETQIEAAKVLVEYGLTEVARPLLSRLEAGVPAARQLLLTVRQIERQGLAQPVSASSADPAESQLDSLQGFLEMPVPNSDTLLIVFAGANNRISMTFSLMHKILRKTGASIVYCRDLRQEWYTRGVIGLGHDYPSTVDGFRTLAIRYGAKRILTLGNCVGCHGALRFGLSLGAQGVLALSPRFQLADSLKPHQRTRRAALREGLPADYKNIHTEYLEAAARPKVALIFGEHYTVDASGVHSMSDVPGVTITGIPDSADPVKDLLVRGLLEALFKHFVANGTVSPELLTQISTSVNPQFTH